MAGYGNKTAPSTDAYDGSGSDTRFGSSANTDNYSGQNEYGSGTTSGAG